MKVLKRVFAGLAILIVLLAIGFLLGPTVKFDPIASPRVPDELFSLSQVDSLVSVTSKITELKPDNGSRIFWADSIPEKTNWALVYLHGFSASPEEGDPVYYEFGKRYGMNVYAPLMPGHGLNVKDPFLDITPNQLIEAAIQAVQVGNSIGDTLILMSCSTGSTLALYLAAANTDRIHSLFLYSPNIELEDQTAKLLTGPWGKQIVYQILGPTKSWKQPGEPPNPKDQYWTTTYRVEGLIALQSLLDNTMADTVLSKISQPYFLGYYYKNEEERDHTISLKAISHFIEISHTPEPFRRVVAFPDVGAHVMTSSLQSKDVQSVLEQSYEFTESVLGLKPVE